MAGVSNMVTALSGAGMTGSYIFSQTIFSMRAGVKSRIHGFIIAGAPLQAMTFILPLYRSSCLLEFIPWTVCSLAYRLPAGRDISIIHDGNIVCDLL